MGNFVSKGLNIAAVSLRSLRSPRASRPRLKRQIRCESPRQEKSRPSTRPHLKSKTRKTVTVSNGHTNESEIYSGVLFVDLLPNTPTGTALHGKVLASYVVAEGFDHYRAVLSLAEIDPTSTREMYLLRTR